MDNGQLRNPFGMIIKRQNMSENNWNHFKIVPQGHHNCQLSIVNCQFGEAVKFRFISFPPTPIPVLPPGGFAAGRQNMLVFSFDFGYNRKTTRKGDPAMKKSSLYAAWGGMFLLCAGLGFISEPKGAARAALTVISLLFFCPPAALLWQARGEGDRPTAAIIRNLSAASLGLTAVLFCANILSTFGSDALGRFLHGMLTIVSAPMLCSGYWALSLFLWACLLVSSLAFLRKE